MFALDTNTVIYYFKGAGGVAERLLATPQRDVALPSIVVYELERGVFKSRSSKRRAEFAAFVNAFTILPLGRAEAEAASAHSTYSLPELLWYTAQRWLHETFGSLAALKVSR